MSNLVLRATAGPDPQRLHRAAPRLKPRRGAPSRLCDQKSARRTGDQRSDERRHLGRTAISHVRASPNLRGPVIVGSGRHELGRPLPPRSLEVGHDDVTHHGSEQGGWREKLVVHRDNNFTQDGQAALPRVYTDELVDDSVAPPLDLAGTLSRRNSGEIREH